MRKVLIAEDDKQQLECLKEALEGWGYDVVTTSTLRDFLSVIRERKFDIVVLDVLFVKEGVVDVLGLPVEYPDTFFVFVTGYFEPFRNKQFRLPDNVVILSKPFMFDVLKKVLEAVSC